MTKDDLLTAMYDFVEAASDWVDDIQGDVDLDLDSYRKKRGVRLVDAALGLMREYEAIEEKENGNG